MTIEGASVVARVRADLTGLQRGMSQAETMVKSGVAQMDRAASSASLGAKLTKDLAPAMGSLGGLLMGGSIAVGVTALTKGIASVGNELMVLGQQSERLNNAFVEQWGSEAPEAMRRMKEASAGAISSMDLTLAANRAAMLGVTQDVDTIVKLMQVARERGQAMGLTTAQAFSDLVTGIGRVSPQILDNLGIVIDAENTYKAYAESIGKTVDSLTEVEQKQALVNKVISGARDVEATAADHTEALKAAKADLRAEIGLLISDFVEETGVVETLTQALQNQTEKIQTRREREQQAAEASKQFRDVLAAVADGAMVNATALASAENAVRRAEEDYADLEITFYDLNQEIQRQSDMLTQLAGKPYSELVRAAEVYANQQRIAKLATDEEALAMGRLADRQAEAAAKGEDLGLSQEMVGREVAQTTEIIGRAYEELSLFEQGLHDAASAWGTFRYLASRQNPYYSPTDPSSAYAVSSARADEETVYGGYGGGYAAVQRRVKEMQQAREESLEVYSSLLDDQKSYAKRSLDLTEDYMRDFRSLVESALQPTQVTAADLAATAAGTYVDKWDEAMRRMRSQGLPADVMAEQERLFYSGQRMELIGEENWDALAAEVQKRIDEEKGRQRLVETAMQEVSERLGGVSREQVAATLGIEFKQEATALASGLEPTGQAEEFTIEWEEEFLLQEERWVGMGEKAVQWMATGIEKGVTPEVTGLLISLLAPRLQEALAGGVRP